MSIFRQVHYESYRDEAINPWVQLPTIGQGEYVIKASMFLEILNTLPVKAVRFLKITGEV